MQTFFQALAFTLAAVAGFGLLTFLLEKYWRARVESSMKKMRFKRALHLKANAFFFIFLGSLAFSFAGAWWLDHPIIGLLGAPFTLYVAGQIFSLTASYRANVLQKSALSFLHALEGLLKMGLSLPAALFRLSQSLPTAFPNALRVALGPFFEGRSLKECLHRFRVGTPLAQVGLCFHLLQMAHERGLPLVPLLHQMLPRLQAEQLRREKLQDLRRSLAAQALLAFSAPWVLVAAFWFFQPDLSADFFSSRSAQGLVAAALAWESLGVWVLWKMTQYQ